MCVCEGDSTYEGMCFVIVALGRGQGVILAHPSTAGTIKIAIYCQRSMQMTTLYHL